MLPLKVEWTSFVEDITDRSVPSGGEIFLIDLDEGSSASRANFTLAREMVRLALGTLTVKVEYTDVYDHPLPTSVRKLDWFHRHI